MKDKSHTCVVCGAPVDINKCRWVNYDNTMSKIIAPEDEPEHGQYGTLAIGNGCAAKLVSEGAIKSDWVMFE